MPINYQKGPQVANGDAFTEGAPSYESNIGKPDAVDTGQYALHAVGVDGPDLLSVGSNVPVPTFDELWPDDSEYTVGEYGTDTQAASTPTTVPSTVYSTPVYGPRAADGYGTSLYGQEPTAPVQSSVTEQSPPTKRGLFGRRNKGAETSPITPVVEVEPTQPAYSEPVPIETSVPEPVVSPAPAASQEQTAAKSQTWRPAGVQPQAQPGQAIVWKPGK